MIFSEKAIHRAAFCAMNGLPSAVGRSEGEAATTELPSSTSHTTHDEPSHFLFSRFGTSGTALA
jgi:hypothetical protein